MACGKDFLDSDAYTIASGIRIDPIQGIHGFNRLGDLFGS